MVKNPPAMLKTSDVGSIPGSGRSSGAGNGQPTTVFLPGQRSLRAAVHRVGQN